MQLGLPIKTPSPDIDRFVRTIRGEEIPERPPLVELFLDHEVVREISRGLLGRDWVEPGDTTESLEAYNRNWIEVYHRLGFDFVRVSGGLSFPSVWRATDDVAALSKGVRVWAEVGTGLISTWEDYENYPWPELCDATTWRYEFVADNLPEGMGLFVCPVSGFLEVPANELFGYENLCYLIHDNPELVAAVFNRVGELIYGFYERLVSLPKVYGFFQGDDMGFRSGTLISPDTIRELVLPWHKKSAELAHRHGKLYLLHSCGQLAQIMDDLIDDVKIDGRHSFEDDSNPVWDFKQRHGNRTAVLGGVDMGKLCTLDEHDLRAYVRRVLECSEGGRYAFGSGNSIANYVPLNNYLIMLNEWSLWSAAA